AERRGDSAHAFDQDRVVPLQELALRARLHGIPDRLETGAVPLLRDLGQRPPDLLVGPAEDEGADPPGALRSAGGGGSFLDDLVRRRERERAAEEENDESESGAAMAHEAPPTGLAFLNGGHYYDQWS